MQLSRRGSWRGEAAAAAAPDWGTFLTNPLRSFQYGSIWAIKSLSLVPGHGMLIRKQAASASMLSCRHAGQTLFLRLRRTCVREYQRRRELQRGRGRRGRRLDVRRTGWACGRVGLKAKDGRQLSVSDGKTRGRENEGQHILYMIIQTTLFLLCLSSTTRTHFRPENTHNHDTNPPSSLHNKQRQSKRQTQNQTPKDVTGGTRYKTTSNDRKQTKKSLAR